MLVVAAHPVPLRVRPPRGEPRLACVLVRTPVEIPELPAGTLRRAEYRLNRIPWAYHVHAGRCWEPLALGPQRRDARGAAGAADLAAALARDGGGWWVEALRGTPFLAEGCGHPLEPGPGTDRILAATGLPHEAAARAAFKAWAEGCLVVEDGRAFLARGMPAFLPHARYRERLASRPPATLERGPAFEAARLPFYAAYAARVGTDRGRDPDHRALAEAASGMPDTGLDLAAFANAGPGAVEALLARAREAAGWRRPHPPELEAAVATLRPLAELGAIAAIQPEGRADSARTVAALLRALRDHLPERYEPTARPRLLAYAETVAIPAGATPPPREDLDHLSGLARLP